MSKCITNNMHLNFNIKLDDMHWQAMTAERIHKANQMQN